MKVQLKRDYAPGDTKAPKQADAGEAMYYRWMDEKTLVMAVLFYGYPGIWFCDIKSIESVV